MRASNEELKEILEEYKDLLDEDYFYFVDNLGIEGTLKLCDYFGGCQIYVPTKRRLLKFPIERYVLNNFDGYNSFKLCSEFGVNNRRLRQLVKEGLNK